MKRWIPFILMISIALFTLLYMVFYGGNEPYVPKTDSPEIIYQQACAHCHGDNGEGSGLLYPAFSDDAYNLQEIKEKITQGTWLMPGFENIKGDTLNSLADFILERGYSKEKQ